MANIVTRPLSIFRKHDSKSQSLPQSHSLHTRWGDTTISAPTDGSWAQYTTSAPPQSSSSTRRSKSKSKSTDKPAYEVEYVPRTHQLIESRPSSTLTPTSTSTTSTSTSTSLSRRLSIRLTPRSRCSRSYCDTTERQPLVERRAQFAYKPIHQDYLSEVAKRQLRHLESLPTASASDQYLRLQLPLRRWSPRRPRRGRASGISLPTRSTRRNSLARVHCARIRSLRVVVTVLATMRTGKRSSTWTPAPGLGVVRRRRKGSRADA